MDTEDNALKMRYIAAFQHLTAESERDDIATYFVPPPNFNMIVSEASVAVFSERGEGKSVLIAMLEKHDLADSGDLRHLWVRWELDAQVNNQIHWLVRFLDRMASVLIEWLAEHPDVAQRTSPSAQKFLGAFIKEALLGDVDLQIGLWAEQTGFLARWVSDASPWDLIRLHPEKAIQLVAQALQQLGLEGVLVLVNLNRYSDRLEQDVQDFLSSLPLLEAGGFVFKCFFPMRLLESFGGTGGIRSYRILPITLSWSTAALREIVQHRIRYLIGKAASLETLTEAHAEIWEWLELVGGILPRVWLHQVRPIVQAYIAQNRPVSTEQWKALRDENPPPLQIDRQGQIVWVGGRKIPFSDFGPQELKVLLYLYENPNRTIRRQDIYFRALEGKTSVPRTPDDEGYEYPEAYRGRLDTVLWRMRQLIEPIPDHPLLLQTKRGQGVVLRVL